MLEPFAPRRRGRTDSLPARGGRLQAAAERVIRWRVVPLALAAAAIVSLHGLVIHHARNVPNADDFILYLQWLDGFQAARGAAAKTSLLLGNINGHVHLVLRLLGLASVALRGTVDFRAIVVSGGAGLLLTFLLLRRTLAPDAHDRAMVALPVALLLFQPRFAEATQWASAAWQCQWIHAFVLLVLHSWDHPRRGRRALAVAWALLATGCQGNGALAPGVVALLAALGGRARRAMAWAALCIAIVMAFHAGQVTAGARVARPPIDLALHSLAYLGAALASGSRDRAVIAGTVVVAVAAVAAVRGASRRCPVPFGLLLFSVASAPANALGRAHLGIQVAYTTNRYVLQSLVALACAYLCAVSLARGTARTWIVLVVAPLALAHGAVGYGRGVDDYRIRSEVLDDSLVRWQVAGDGLATLDPPLARAVMARSIEAGLYRPPVVDPLPLAPVVEGEVPPAGALLAALDHFLVTPDHVIVDGWSASAEDGRPAPVSIAFVGRRRTLVFAAAPRTRPDVGEALRAGGLDVRGNGWGYFALVPRSLLGPVPYRVELIGSSGGRSVRVATGHSLPRPSMAGPDRRHRGRTDGQGDVPGTSDATASD